MALYKFLSKIFGAVGFCILMLLWLRLFAASPRLVSAKPIQACGLFAAIRQPLGILSLMGKKRLAFKLHNTIKAAIKTNAKGLRHAKGSVFYINALRHIYIKNTEAEVRRTNASKGYTDDSPKKFEIIFLIIQKIRIFAAQMRIWRNWQTH
jgi:hypothetical protein